MEEEVKGERAGQPVSGKYRDPKTLTIVPGVGKRKWVLPGRQGPGVFALGGHMALPGEAGALPWRASLSVLWPALTPQGELGIGMTGIGLGPAGQVPA
jgi:hypothetical protein